MKELLGTIIGGVAGLCMLVLMFALQLIPMVISVYCGIWVLDYFGVTNIL